MPVKLPMEKLKLLFLIQQAHFPVSREDLWEFCDAWLTYFSLQAALHQLFDQGLIEAGAVFTAERRYRTTENGNRTLDLLYREIPQSQRTRLEQDALRLREKARTAIMYLSDYYKMDSGQYIAELSIVERGIILLKLTVNLPTMEQAGALCGSWSKAAPEVYGALMRHADPEPESTNE